MLFISGINVQECGCRVFYRAAVSSPAPLQRNSSPFSKKWHLPEILIVCFFSLFWLPRSLTSQVSHCLLAFLHSGWELLLPGVSSGAPLFPFLCSAHLIGSCVQSWLLVWDAYFPTYMSAEVCCILSSKHTIDMGYGWLQLPLLVHLLRMRADIWLGKWLLSYSCCQKFSYLSGLVTDFVKMIFLRLTF